MAKRKRSYGGDVSDHASEARIQTRNIRRLASEIRADLKHGDCNQAIQDLGVLNRAVGSVRVHRPAYTRGSATPWKVAISLEGKVYRRCVLKRKSYRSPR